VSGCSPGLPHLDQTFDLILARLPGPHIFLLDPGILGSRWRPIIHKRTNIRVAL
jgi:hypothetical protein